MRDTKPAGMLLASLWRSGVAGGVRQQLLVVALDQQQRWLVVGEQNDLRARILPQNRQSDKADRAPINTRHTMSSVDPGARLISPLNTTRSSKESSMYRAPR